MMELHHIAMVNWHLFDVEDIEITGHTGVFGENRSGKSTILDMDEAAARRSGVWWITALEHWEKTNANGNKLEPTFVSDLPIPRESVLPCRSAWRSKHVGQKATKPSSVASS